MLFKSPPKAKSSETHVPSEGALYKIVTTFGKTFELRYGYYGEIDRGEPPDVIYPDFRAHPVYAESGEPFVTRMQDACRRFRGQGPRTEDSTCAECRHFRRGEEWFGLCTHPANKSATHPQNEHMITEETL